MISDFVVLAHTIDEILNIAEKIKHQSLLPSFVVFGFIEERKSYHDDTLTNSYDVNMAMNKIVQIFDGKIQFIVTRILDTICNYQCIDICVKKCHGDYYSVIFANEELPDYFNFQLDTIIANNKIYMIQPNKGLHGLVIHRGLHKHLSGSMSFNKNQEPYLNKITDKILGYAKKETIYKWEN